MSACTRSASCRCADCTAAMNMFSAKDLTAIASSKINFDKETDITDVSTKAEQNTQKIIQADQPKEKEKTSNLSDITSEKTNSSKSKEDSNPIDNREFRNISSATDTESQDNFSELPLKDLLASQNWKARKFAYEKLQAICEKPPVPKESSDLLSTEQMVLIVSEGSIAALDFALKCVSAFIQNVYDFNSKDDNDSLFVKSVVSRLSSKALSARAGTKSLGEEVILCLCELGKPCLDTVCETLTEHVSTLKSPKAQQACLACLYKCIIEFGIKKIPLETIKDAALKGFVAKNPLVRREATNLFKISNDSLQGAFKNILLGELKNETQKREIEKLCNGVPEPVPEPKRTFRNEPKTEDSKCSNDTATNSEDALFDMLSENKIICKLDSIKFDKKIAEKKWQERKGIICEVQKLCGNPPKLNRSEDYTALLGKLRTLILRDSNQAVVIEVIKLLGIFALGLRGGFSFSAKSVLPLLLQRYKDKKAPLVAAVNQTLDNFTKYCISFQDEKVCGYVEEAFSSKSTPIQRDNIVGWIRRSIESGCFFNLERDQSIEGINMILSLLRTAVDDADPKVRTCATNALSKLHQKRSSISGPCADIIESNFEILSKQNSRAFAKITSSGNNIVSHKESNSKNTQPKDTDGIKISNKRENVSSSGTRTRATSHSSISQKKANSVNARISASNKIEQAKSPEREKLNENLKFMGIDQATQTVLQLIPGIQDAINGHDEAVKWQDRQPLFGAVSEYISNCEEVTENIGEAIFVFLGAKTRDLKDSNFNIMNLVWINLTVLAEKNSLPKVCVLSLLPKVIAKLPDRKQGDTVRNLLLTCSESYGPSFILENIYKHNEMSKTSPKVLEECVNFMTSIIEDFGAAQVEVKKMMQYLISELGLKAKQITVKKAATHCVLALYRQIGEPIKKLLGADNTIESELNKVQVVKEQNVVFKRTSKVAKISPVLEDLNAPRKDISSVICSQKLIEKLQDTSTKTAWKIRFKAIEDTIICMDDANRNIQLNRTVMKLVAALKSRLRESNKNLVNKSIVALGVVGNSVGGESVPSIIRACGNEILSCLTGSNKIMLTNTVRCLNDWVVHEDDTTHVDAFLSLLSLCPTPLCSAKTDRLKLLDFVLCHFESINAKTKADDFKNKLEIEDLVNSLLSCLQSRDAQTRKTALKVIIIVVNILGVEQGEAAFKIACRDLKPAVNRTIAPLLKSAYKAAEVVVDSPLAQFKAENNENNLQQTNTIIPKMQAPSRTRTKSDTGGRKPIPSTKTTQIPKRTGQAFSKDKSEKNLPPKTPEGLPPLELPATPVFTNDKRLTKQTPKTPDALLPLELPATPPSPSPDKQITSSEKEKHDSPEPEKLLFSQQQQLPVPPPLPVDKLLSSSPEKSVLSQTQGKIPSPEYPPSSMAAVSKKQESENRENVQVDIKNIKDRLSRLRQNYLKEQTSVDQTKIAQNIQDIRDRIKISK